MTELDEAIERFARPRRTITWMPDETDEQAGRWAFEQLLAEVSIALRRRGVEPVTTVMSPRPGVYKQVAACWPLEVFALTPRGVALPYSMLTGPTFGCDPAPRPDAPVLRVDPTPIVVGDGPADVEVNRRGQLLWRWSESPEGRPWTTGFRERFDANATQHRPSPLHEPLAFAIVDHMAGRLERGIVH